MTSKCSSCNNRFDILDTFRCNDPTCNTILCKSCATIHNHTPNLKVEAGTCSDQDCEGCYSCFPSKIKCDCRQYKNLGHCVHMAALSGW